MERLVKYSGSNSAVASSIPSRWLLEILGDPAKERGCSEQLQKVRSYRCPCAYRVAISRAAECQLIRVL